MKWFQRTHTAVWQGGGIVGISFGALGIALWHLLITLCTGGFGLAWSVPVGRHLTNLYRRLAGEWAGVPIDVPYRPQRLRLEMEADGRYKVGRWLVDNRAPRCGTCAGTGWPATGPPGATSRGRSPPRSCRCRCWCRCCW